MDRLIGDEVGALLADTIPCAIEVSHDSEDKAELGELREPVKLEVVRWIELIGC